MQTSEQTSEKVTLAEMMFVVESSSVRPSAGRILAFRNLEKEEEWLTKVLKEF